MKRSAKRSIEIYFVLYIASIVTLLAVANERNRKERQLSEALAVLSRPDFHAEAEKISLTYQYFPPGVNRDTSLSLQQDTMNVIMARGSFDRADFSVVSVIDTITGEMLPADYLALEQVSRDSAIFQWSPHTINGNHVYRVTVRATADPTPPAELKDQAIRNEVASVLAERGSTLNANVVFTINTYALGLQVPTELPSNMMANVPFSVIPRNDIVGAFVNVPWSNGIIVSGANVNSQMAKPKVGSSSGAVNVNITSPTSFEVSGLFSQTGTQDVEIEATRLTDNQKFNARFRVNVQEFPQPTLPQYLYAGEEYSFDIRQKDIPSSQLSVELSVGGAVKISRAMNQPMVTFTPDAVNTGETVNLASYLNDRQVWQSRIPIVALPRPEILSIEPDKDGFIVATKSYGHYGNQPNRARLIVREGNVGEPEELTDQYHYDNVTKAHYQKWHLTRHGEGEIIMNLYAIDARGLDYKSQDFKRHF
jgi:starvation-inducible outer membrane lipoprotein